MKMRFFGLGARVMQKLGVSTQLLAGADIYPALEKGVIDATEFSMPDIDQKLGFYQIAKFNYYPGWHQQVSCSEFLFNQAKFDELPDSFQAMIEIAAGHQVAYTYADTEAKNPAAMKRHEVEVRRDQTSDGPMRTSPSSRRPGTRSWLKRARRTRCSRRPPRATRHGVPSTRAGADAQSLASHVPRIGT